MFGNFLNSLPLKVNSAVGNFFRSAKNAITAPFRGGQSANVGMNFPVSPQTDIFSGQKRNIRQDALVSQGFDINTARQTAKQEFETGNIPSDPFAAQSKISNPQVLAQRQTDAGSEFLNRQSTIDSFNKRREPIQSRQKDTPTTRLDPITGKQTEGSVGGFSGFNPESLFSFSASSFSPTSGLAGSPGITSGGSSFSGLLGAQSGQNTPSVQVASDKNNRTLQDRRVQTQEELNNFGFNKFLDPATGELKSGVQPFIPSGISQPQAGPNINLSDMTGGADPALSSRAAFSSNDFAETIASIDQKYADSIAFSNLTSDAAPTTPPTTNEINNFLQTADINESQRMRDIIEASGISRVEKQRVETITALNGVTEAYQGVIDDIKNNPDLPKGLARRRLESVYSMQKNITTQLLGTLEGLNASIDSINSQIERENGILSAGVNQQDRQRKQLSDNLELLIRGGAIGGMNDRELQQWSDATGVPVRAVSKARETALLSDKESILKLDKLAADIAKAQRVDTGGGGITTSEGFVDFNTEADVRGTIGGLIEDGVDRATSFSLARGNFSRNEVSDFGINTVLDDFYGGSVGDDIESLLTDPTNFTNSLPGEKGGSSLDDLFGFTQSNTEPRKSLLPKGLGDIQFPSFNSITSSAFNLFK